jgi:dTDP-4-dehydrorhamnose 3,5-epimerase-like enzyme
MEIASPKITIEELPVTDRFLRQKRLIQDRGELALIEDGITIRHLGYFSLKAEPGYFRGGHYHAKKIERFYVIAGRLSLRFVDLETRNAGEIELSSGMRISIQPNCAHLFRAEEFAEVIEYYESVYDPEDDIRYDFPLG